MSDKFDKHYQFLLKMFGDKISKRFEVLWSETIIVLKAMGLEEKVRIDEESFNYAILDYFTDLAKIKEFHNVKKINSSKMYAYEMYWLLRRRPIHCLVPVKGSYDLNEKVFLGIFIPKILEEGGLSYKSEVENTKTRKHIKAFIDLLFYNLKYRQYTPQSLELMIEAFLSGCNLSK